MGGGCTLLVPSFLFTTASPPRGTDGRTDGQTVVARVSEGTDTVPIVLYFLLTRSVMKLALYTMPPPPRLLLFTTSAKRGETNVQPLIIYKAYNALMNVPRGLHCCNLSRVFGDCSSRKLSLEVALVTLVEIFFQGW